MCANISSPKERDEVRFAGSPHAHDSYCDIAIGTFYYAVHLSRDGLALIEAKKDRG